MFDADAYPEMFLDTAQDRIREMEYQRVLEQRRRTRRQARRARVRQLLIRHTVTSRS
ncbi:MAG TPA: hypothetical protein VH395_02455 [Jatrophihabitantaceae bacterium]|jgi:hypothetical protein